MEGQTIVGLTILSKGEREILFVFRDLFLRYN